MHAHIHTYLGTTAPTVEHGSKKKSQKARLKKQLVKHVSSCLLILTLPRCEQHGAILGYI